MTIAKSIKLWLDREAKIWLLRLAVFGVILLTFYAEVTGTTLNTNTLIAAVLALLLIFSEIFLDGVSQMRLMSQDGLLIQKGTTLDNVLNDARQASSLIVVVRSGESTYYKLSEVIRNRRERLSVRLIFTTNNNDDEDFKKYQKIWIGRWLNLFNENLTVFEYHVVSTDLEPECVIIDNKIGYFNYRFHKEEQKWIESTRLSNQGSYLMDLYIDWIEQLKLVEPERPQTSP